MITEQSSPRARARAAARGMTLIEVLVAFAILSVSILGLVAGLVVASTANGWAATRTQASEFALSRLERFRAVNPLTICSTIATDVSSQNCTVMTNAPTPFVPDVAAASGGWMMDVLDWPLPATGNGDDLMAGPVVVIGDSNTVDTAKTLALRSTMYTNWTGAAGTGCDSTLVTSNPAVLCREIHIEPETDFIPDSGVSSPTSILHVWVRVLRGGTTDWRLGSVNMDTVVAQQ